MVRSLLKLFLKYFILLTIFFYIYLNAQHPLLEEKKKKLNPILEAGDLINSGLFQKAQWLIEDYLRESLESDNKTEAYFLLLKSFIAQKKYEDAYFICEELSRLNISEIYFSNLLYYNGLSAFHTQRYWLSIEFFKKLSSLGEDPSLKFLALYYLALIYYENQNYIEAEKFITTASENLNTNYPEGVFDKIGTDDILFLQASIYEAMGENLKAVNYLEKLITENKVSPLFLDANIKLVSILIKLGRNARALDYLNSIIPVTSIQKQQWLYYKAEAEYNLNFYSKSIQSYSELIKQFPAGKYTRQASYNLAWSYFKTNDYLNAVKYFKQVTTIDDTLTENSLYQIGLLLSLMDSALVAVETYEQLISKFPYGQYADRAYYQIGLIKFRLGHYPEARRNFQLAARIFPNSKIRKDSYRMLGELSLIVGDLSNAQFAFAQTQKYATSDTLAAIAIYQEGVALYQLGRFRSSSEKFSEFIRKFKNHYKISDAYFWLAEAYYQDGKYEEAENSYLTAIKMLSKENPKKISALYGLSWSLFEQKKFRQAIHAFDDFIAESQNNSEKIEATLRKADCYFYLREYEKATQIYALLSQDRKNPRYAEYAAFQLGLSFIQRGEVNRGVENLKKFLLNFPNSIYSEVVQFNIGWAYFTSEQYDKAIQEFDLFLSKYSESQLMPRVLLNKADAFYNSHSYDSAIVYYKRVIEEYPNSLLRSDAINGLQFTYQAQNKSSEAIAVIDELITKQQGIVSNEELFLRKGDLYFEQGNFAQAVSEYQKVIQMQSSDSIIARALFQLGRCFEYENNPYKAEEYFNQILKKYPDSELAPSAALSAGNLLMKQKRWKDAEYYLLMFETIFSNSPHVWEARYNIGVSQLAQKNFNNARQQFEKIILQAPVNEVFAFRSRLQLARILQTKKFYQASNDTLSFIIQNIGDDIAAEALLIMGENFLLLKNPKSALEAFNQVIESFSNYPLLVERALLGSGECYVRLKDRTNARKVYQQILKNPIDPAVKKDAEERLRRLQ